MDIKELFDTYTDAFNQLDATAIARCYTLPCALKDGDGQQVFNETEDLLAKFEKNCRSMRGMQYQSATFEIVELSDLGQEGKSVTVKWCINTSNTNFEFNSLYICHKEENQWRIFVANVYHP